MKNGIDHSAMLIVYHRSLKGDASTIMEHVDAIGDSVGCSTWKINMELGFPRACTRLQFPIIVLHYSLFGAYPFQIDRNLREFLSRNTASIKVAFFQDEYQHCQARFNFINNSGINAVFTLVDPCYWDQTYCRYTQVKTIRHCIPGYVSPRMLQSAERFSLPPPERTIDVAYRGRKLPAYMGRGALEKHNIATDFLRLAAGTALRHDVAADEPSRLYGDAWPRFLGRAKCVLGVEAGVSLFDIDGSIFRQWQVAQRDQQCDATFLDRETVKLAENRLPYRTISPRHFEAAAFRCGQVLFPGRYSGIMKPHVHYFPLERDWGNWNDVHEFVANADRHRAMAERAYRDLIASGTYTYANFVKCQFIPALSEAGHIAILDETMRANVDLAFRRANRVHYLLKKVYAWRYREFPGRRWVMPWLRPLYYKWRHWQASCT